MSEPTSEAHRKLNAEEKAFAKRLGSRNVKKRQKAAQEILEMGSAGRDLLIAVMRHEVRHREDMRLTLYINLVLQPIVFGIPALLLYLQHGKRRWVSMMVGNLTGYLVVLIGVGIYAQVVRRAHINAAYLLAKHFEDISIIGPLAEALEYRSKSVREAAAALTRLLPQLQEADADLLTASQFSHLHRALMGNNPKLVRAVLCAFAQVGGSQVMPNVQKLAAELGSTENDLHIRNAAEQTLLHLNRRIEAQRALQTLLRPASANAIGNEILLRPAVNVSDTPEYVLLRPSDNTNQESGA